MLYILLPIWLMTKVVVDSCNMESNVYTQTVHQSLSPNLPYPHTNLVSGSMFISIPPPKKRLNIQFEESYFFSHEQNLYVWKKIPKSFKPHFWICFQHFWSIYHTSLKSSMPYSEILTMTTAWYGQFGFCSLNCFAFF